MIAPCSFHGPIGVGTETVWTEVEFVIAVWGHSGSVQFRRPRSAGDDDIVDVLRHLCGKRTCEQDEK